MDGGKRVHKYGYCEWEVGSGVAANGSMMLVQGHRMVRKNNEGASEEIGSIIHHCAGGLRTISWV